jgi:hypothetical protein
LSVFNLLNLILPALFPSWRFFDVIGPSPRIELCLLENSEDDDDRWQEYRPKRARIGVPDRLKAFFWNAPWNETLYLATCAERLIQGQSDHSAREIRRRIRADVLRDTGGDAASPFFRFRLVFVSRYEDRLRRDVAYVSPAYRVSDPVDP